MERKRLVILCAAGVVLTVLMVLIYEFGIKTTPSSKTTDSGSQPEPVQAGLNCSIFNSSGTMWEQYQYHVCTGPKLQPKCFPTMYQPANLSATAGLLVYFHGFSACPSSAIPYAEYMSSQHNFYVYNFLFPGHGRLYNDCVVAGECADGYPTESLPVTRQAYVDMIKQSVEIIRSEVQRLNLSGQTIAVSGLSHGGAAAAYAASISEGLFTHQLSINAFFGLSDGGIDDLQYQCWAEGTDSDVCLLRALDASMFLIGMNSSDSASNITSSAVQSFLNQTTAIELGVFEKWAYVMNILRNEVATLTEYRSLLPAFVTNFMENVIGWGDFCVLSMQEAGRGGFCNFKIKNVLAAHSFADYALAQTRLTPKSVNVQYMTVERDGPTRLSLEWQGAQSAARNGAPVHMCTFRIMPDCTNFTDDLCGVPHSCLDPSDEILHLPYEIYWQPFIFNQSAAFLTNQQDSIGVQEFDGYNIGQCIAQSLFDPDPKLVTYVIKGGILQLSSFFLVNSGTLDAAIFESLISQLNQPSWAVSFTRLESPDNSKNNFLIEVLENVEPTLIEMITNGTMTSVAFIPIEGYYQESTQKTFLPSSSLIV
jgi:hypothetical protein